MARLTALQISQLDRMNKASQRAGGLGTIIDTLQYGGVSTPSAGSLVQVVPVTYSFAPVLGTATKVHAAITLGASAQTTITTGITNPDVPRVVSVKGNAASIAGNVIITGTDFNGASMTETIALNESTEVFGVKAFKTVTNINVPAKTNVSGDTVSIGTGNVFGFPVAIPNTSLVLAKSFNGAVDTGTVTASATLAASVFAINGTPDGAKIVKLYFLV